jgi:Flp pilus assembly protein TadG
MIEATLGTFLLLFAALGAIQIVLYLHGELAAHAAASHMARSYALTRSQAEADEQFADQRYSSFGFLRWANQGCTAVGGFARCTVAVTVPTLLPGVQFTGLTQRTATGAYPLPGRR